jgi:hypothetical protein
MPSMPCVDPGATSAQHGATGERRLWISRMRPGPAGCWLVSPHGGSENVDEETAAPVDELEAVE